MKLPMQWIEEYSKIPVEPQVYQDKMIMQGVAVEGIEDSGKEVSKVVVGRVLEVGPVENSDHLSLCKVDVGEEEPLQIVCGAPNVKVDILVPVALVGATLPGNFKIKRGKIRGVESFGMICSSTELQVPTDLYPSVGEEGILIFQEEYPLGADVKPILGIDDQIVEFEILANRPDCLSVWGIARETAVAMGTSFEKPLITVKEVSGKVDDLLTVKVEAPDLCTRYMAKVVKNIKIAPSPFWLRKYLHGAGVRSINNIVDITNFVMLETGHPMHAFDLDKVTDQTIIVRQAKEGEKLVTLDEKERILSGTELLICDGKEATGLAGIMGGAQSEITENTKNIVFECAAFDRTNTRISSRKLGLRTESSSRFEKGVFPHSVEEAMKRACQMVNKLDAGEVVEGAIDIYPVKEEEQKISVKTDYIAHRAGIVISVEDMIKSLEALYFQVEQEKDTLHVRVPMFRHDVDGPADICEEVLRVYGFDHIPSTLLRGEITQGGKNPRLRQKDQINHVLNGLGYYEIMKFSFISPKAIEKLNLPQDDLRKNPVKILNPLGEDTSVMRTTLVPSMLETLSYNQKQGNEWAKLYENAPVFNGNDVTDEGLPQELPMLAMGLYGGKFDFFSLKGDVLALLNYLGIEEIEISREGENYHHPGRCASFFAQGKKIATFGEVHPENMEQFDLSQRAYICEMDLLIIKKQSTPMGTAKALPKFPAVTRDLALVMNDDVPIGDVMKTMVRAGGKTLEKCEMFDVFKGKQLGEGIKSVAFSLAFRSEEKTLTEEEVNKTMTKILKACENEHHAMIRG